VPWWSFGKKDTRGELSPEIQRIFEKAVRFLDDEVGQNNALPENLRQVLTQNHHCDKIPNGFGEFGRTLTNPVPVNGPMGELVYLSRLETADGVPIAFHRLGAFGNVDIFEIVSENGRYWDVLYVSLYYPRKSRVVPSGYRMMGDQSRRSLIRGTTLQVGDFPQGIFRAVLECTGRMVGTPIADTRLKALESRNDIIRPGKHLENLRRIKFSSHTSFESDGDVQNNQELDHDKLFNLFRETLELLKEHIRKYEDQLDITLSYRFDQELTYLLLYLFTTILFMSASLENPGQSADRLVKWSLAGLSHLGENKAEDIIGEYQKRFDHFRQIELFTTEDHILVDEGSSSVGQQLSGVPNMLFGGIAIGLISTVIVSLREELISIQT
jgi:hypothetical protein